jgi:hypothetical protein
MRLVKGANMAKNIIKISIPTAGWEAKTCFTKGVVLDGNKLIYATLVAGQSIGKDISKVVQNKGSLILKYKGEMLMSIDGFIDRREKIEKPFKAMKLSIVATEASKESGDMNKQYFLIPKGVEEPIEELKKLFFSRLMSSLPIPVKEEWMEFYWQSILQYVRELQVIGDPIYIGYAIEVGKIEDLLAGVAKAHTSYEFKSKFRRVPQLTSLLEVIDVNRFNFKKWMNFLNASGGKEKFESLEESEQKEYVWAFEAFEDTISINKDVYNLIHSLKLRRMVSNLALKASLDEDKYKEIKDALQRIARFYVQEVKKEVEAKEEALMMSIRLLENIEDILKEAELQLCKEAIFKGNFKRAYNLLSSFYRNINKDIPEAVKLAETASLYKLSQDTFEEYQYMLIENLARAKSIAKSYPTIEGKVGNASWAITDASDPRALLAGEATYCCQTIGGAGASCVNYFVENPGRSGVFVVEQKGKIKAQSFFWLTEPNKEGKVVLCLDNVELAGENTQLKDSVIEAYKEMARKLLCEPRFSWMNIEAITVGTGYSDLNMAALCQEEIDKDSKYYAIKPGDFYSDARTQWLLASKESVECDSKEVE